jgi:hypothetical protein
MDQGTSEERSTVSPKDKNPGPDAEVVTEEQSSVDVTREREQERKQAETEAKEREAEQAKAEEEKGEQPDTRTPEEIREDIRKTRVELGDTAEQLGAKSDVKAQAKSKVDEVKGRLTSKKDELAAKAKESIPSGDDSTGADGSASAQQKAQQGAQQVVGKVQENPTPAIVAGAALVGFLIGRWSA